MQTPIEKTLRDMLDVALDNISDLSERMAARSAIANTDLNNMRAMKDKIAKDLFEKEQVIIKLKIALDAAQEKSNA
jgi:hypothetical protein